MITMVTVNTNKAITSTTTSVDTAVTATMKPIVISEPKVAAIHPDNMKVAEPKEPETISNNNNKDHRSTSVDLTSDTTSATDLSSADQSLLLTADGHNKQSQDLWVRVCEHKPQEATTTDADNSIHEELNVTSATLSPTQEEEEESPDAPILPISEEEEATSMHSHDNLDILAETEAIAHHHPISSSTTNEEEADEALPSPDVSLETNYDDDDDEINKEQAQQQVRDSSSSSAVGSDDLNKNHQPSHVTDFSAIDEDSTILHSDRGSFTAKSKDNKEPTTEGRFSSVTFTTDPGINSSEFLLTPDNRGIEEENTSTTTRKNNEDEAAAESVRMTASERWRDDTKAQGLTSIPHDSVESVRMTASERWRDDTNAAQGLSPSVPHHDTAASSEFLLTPENRGIETHATTTQKNNDDEDVENKGIEDTNTSNNTSNNTNNNIDNSARTTKSKDSNDSNGSNILDVSTSDRMTASERWRDDAKDQDLPSSSRKLNVKPSKKNKGDFGPPSIPRRTSFDSNVSMVSSAAAAPPQPKKSILKASIDEKLYIKSHRRCWKKLPPPDMENIKMTRLQMLEFLRAQQEVEKEEEEERTKSTIPQSQLEGTPLKSLPEGSMSSDADVTETKHNNNVVFESIIIREHQQTIGDNPSVSYGTPISLDWPYMDNEPLDLDVYESKKRPRTTRQMFLNHYQRKNILIHKYGHSVAEVKAAKYATNKIRNQRNMSKMMQTSFQPLLVFEEMRESAVRKAKRRISNGSSSKRGEEGGGSSTGSILSNSELEEEGPLGNSRQTTED